MACLPSDSPAVLVDADRAAGDAWASRQCQRLEQVLAFMLPHVGKLPDYARYWKKTESNSPRVGEKIACELAWLLLLGRRLRLGEDIARAFDYLASDLVPAVRSSENLLVAIQNPQFASSFAIAHWALTDAGYPDPTWDRVVETGIRNARFDIKERYPHRILERLWMLGLYGFPASVSSSEVARFSILAGDADPLTMTESDAYAYTHAIFYLTDFGRRALPPVLDSAHIRTVVDAAISWQIGQRNCDLLGEFLVCSALLGGPPSARALLGLSIWNGTWDELGFLPGPSFQSEVFESLEGDARRAYAFAQIYHTNLVGGLLAVVALHGCPTSSEGTDAGEADHVASESKIAVAIGLLDRIRPTLRTDRWSILVRDAVVARPRLFGALLDALLISAVRAGDFESLNQSLMLLVDTRPYSTWVLERVVGYLNRFKLVEPDRISPALGTANLAALESAAMLMEQLRPETSSSSQIVRENDTQA